jgi:hypothetical protein
VLRTIETLGFAPEGYLVLAVALFFHASHRVEQGESVFPLEIVADGVLEDLGQRGAMVIVEVYGL